MCGGISRRLPSFERMEAVGFLKKETDSSPSCCHLKISTLKLSFESSMYEGGGGDFETSSSFSPVLFLKVKCLLMYSQRLHENEICK